MAILDTTSCPGNWDQTSESTDEWLARTDAMLRNLEPVLSFPVADGYALYFVKSRNPLVLQHIPYLDAYQIPLAHIRGLTEADVDAQVAVAKRWAALAETKPTVSVSIATEPAPVLPMGEGHILRVYDFGKAPRGLLVTRSPHWYEQTGVKPKVPVEVGIVVTRDFQADLRNSAICWPEVHWEGEMHARTSHPVNVIPYRKKARTTIPIVTMVE